MFFMKNAAYLDSVFIHIHWKGTIPVEPGKPLPHLKPTRHVLILRGEGQISILDFHPYDTETSTTVAKNEHERRLITLPLI